MLKKIIIILSLLIVLLVLWMVYQKFFIEAGVRSRVTVEYSEIDPGRLVLGKKISIRDGVKIPLVKYVVIEGKTATILGKIDLGLADNMYRELEETIYIEEGYFSEDIISAERYDTVQNGRVIGSHLRIALPLPDTIQCFGMNAREKNIAPFFIGFLPGEDAVAQLDSFKLKMVESGYRKWRSEWFKSLQENLEYTALTMANFLNEAARIGQSQPYKSITSIFNFEYNGRVYHMEIMCDAGGKCQTMTRQSTDS